jgi:hypothetical protein
MQVIAENSWEKFFNFTQIERMIHQRFATSKFNLALRELLSRIYWNRFNLNQFSFAE